MKTLKLNAFIFDKNRIFKTKITYDPNTRLGIIKRFRGETTRFYIDPNHIYALRSGFKDKLMVFIDNASRRSVKTAMPITVYNPDGTKRTEMQETNINCAESVKMHSENPLDTQTITSLDILTEQSFWKSLITKQKLSLSTVLLLLFAGVGLYHFFLTILRILGVNV